MATAIAACVYGYGGIRGEGNPPFTGGWDGIVQRLETLERNIKANLRAGREVAAIPTVEPHAERFNTPENSTLDVNAGTGMHQTVPQDRVEGKPAETQQTAYKVEIFTGEANRDPDFQSTSSASVDHQMVRFEVGMHQSRELTPGLGFTLLRTDAGRQVIDGFVHLMPDGHMLWIHDHGIQQPMLFRSPDERREFQLVFTRITREGVLGRVLLSDR
jgi:hypothetical protein